ncbi:MAG: SH3 domain-containing protein [Chloroflexota bacterium]
MNRKPDPVFRPVFWMMAALLLAALACALPSTPAPTTEPSPPTETPTPFPEASPTSPPSPTTSPTDTPQPGETPPTPTEQVNRCVIVQDLNIRTGPGLAYHTPVGVIPKDSVVQPTSYYPVGVPGGTWALIEAEGGRPGGWIAAGSDYISCNFDLNSLPKVQVEAPPPPRLPRGVQSSDPEGDCYPESVYGCEVIVTNESFIQFKLTLDGNELTQNDNLLRVQFNVTRDNENGPEVYASIDNGSAYCIFGGGQPCNPWTLKNNVYYWADGPKLEAGKYFVEILATVDEGGFTDTIRWAAEFTIELP